MDSRYSNFKFMGLVRAVGCVISMAFFVLGRGIGVLWFLCGKGVFVGWADFF